MKSFFIISVVIFLGGCATQSPYGDGSASAGIADLPPVGLFYSELNESTEQECADFRNKSIIHYCRENAFDLDELSKALSASGRFSRVAAWDPASDYQVMVSSATFDVDDARGLANAVVSGTTLMLYPITEETTLKAEFVVTWRGHIIDRFAHEIPVEYSLSILTDPNVGRQAVAKALADKLLQSIDSHESMSAERLFEAVDASNYDADMAIPEQVGEFRLTDQGLFHDPFAGTMLRFNHKQFLFDRIDVFVYPVRGTSWSNSRELIGHEMNNVRSEIQYLEKEGHISDVDLGDAEVLHWKTDSQNAEVGFMEGYYADSSSDRFYTSVYAFIKEDKFVKVRASFPITLDDASVVAPDAFVRALIPSLTVPGESRFMARLRENHRDHNND